MERTDSRIKGPPTEPEIAVATFIILPETTLEIQSALIRNATKIEIEVTLRIKDKIQEIVINL